MVEPPAVSEEASFRSSLEDVIVVVKKLSPLCKTPEELIGLCELAVSNDAQLTLLFQQVMPTRMRK